MEKYKKILGFYLLRTSFRKLLHPLFEGIININIYTIWREHNATKNYCYGYSLFLLYLTEKWWMEFIYIIFDYKMVELNYF